MGLDEEATDGIATVAMTLAQDTLTGALVDALEEADRNRARSVRRRGIVGSALGLGIGTAIGYALRGNEDAILAETETADATEHGTEAIERGTGATEGTTSTETPPRRSRMRGAFSKLAIATLAAGGLYLLRRRQDRAREMVEEATQHVGGAGDRASEHASEIAEETEAVAAGVADQFEEVGEEASDVAEDAGDIAEDAGETAADEIEATGEQIEEAAEEVEEETDDEE